MRLRQSRGRDVKGVKVREGVVETVRNWVNRQVAGSQDEWLDQLI